MFMIHNTVYEEGKECLDIKMYDSLSRDEEMLVSHTRVYHGEDGKLAQRVLFPHQTLSLK